MRDFIVTEPESLVSFDALTLVFSAPAKFDVKGLAGFCVFNSHNTGSFWMVVHVETKRIFDCNGSFFWANVAQLRHAAKRKDPSGEDEGSLSPARLPAPLPLDCGCVF